MRVNEWNSLAINSFELVKNIKQKYVEGTPEQKRTILRIIGSDLKIVNRKLEVQLRTPFELISNSFKEIDKNFKLGPDDLADMSANRFVSGDQKNIWGGRRDLNPQPPDPQSGALTN